MALVPFEAFLTDHAQAVLRLYSQARPERWQVSELDFAAILHRSAAGRFPGETMAAPAEVDRYLDTLFVEDLALACACERGLEPAWLDFLERFRSILLAAARSLAGAEEGARELADGIYADLYGLEERDGKRRSLFAYFHGRSSLATWLRSVLARSYVNQYRQAQRGQALRSRLADEVRADPGSAAPPVDPDRSRHVGLLRQALSEAIAELPSRDRLRLSYYHVQQLTLAQVGRLLGEHESTASRKIEHARQALRKSVERRLRENHRLSGEQIRVCLETALDVSSFDVGAEPSEA
jgi:RNA polymerase sigma-70 factor, ECF subfamily